jgi:hypothetical protein
VIRVSHFASPISTALTPYLGTVVTDRHRVVTVNKRPTVQPKRSLQ